MVPPAAKWHIMGFTWCHPLPGTPPWWTWRDLTRQISQQFMLKFMASSRRWEATAGNRWLITNNRTYMVHNAWYGWEPTKNMVKGYLQGIISNNHKDHIWWEILGHGKHLWTLWPPTLRMCLLYSLGPLCGSHGSNFEQLAFTTSWSTGSSVINTTSTSESPVNLMNLCIIPTQHSQPNDQPQLSDELHSAFPTSKCWLPNRSQQVVPPGGAANSCSCLRLRLWFGWPGWRRHRA